MDKNVTDRNVKTDIELVLKPIEGSKPTTTTGMVDSRLFQGDNTLHAKMNSQTCLWHLEMDKGILPKPLQQQFTGFSRLLAFVKDYYRRRNVQITEIRD